MSNSLRSNRPGASSLRSACHQSDGSLTVNGTALAVKGRCSALLATGRQCGCRLYSDNEHESGVCVDHGAHAGCKDCGERVGVHRLSEEGCCARCFVRVMGAA